MICANTVDFKLLRLVQDNYSNFLHRSCLCGGRFIRQADVCTNLDDRLYEIFGKGFGLPEVISVGSGYLHMQASLTY